MKTIFSGLQPSGIIHIGNYLGAIEQWVNLQENNQAYYCIVDQHAITTDYDPQALPDRVLDTAALYLAAGLNPAKSTLFIQSHVAAHSELAWLLATQTPFGELTRMTQFKEKAARQKSASLGLFAYPVLMAADILLYQTDTVPVGADQTQHLELTRDIATRFNNKFGQTFTVPKPHLNQKTARIMSLTDPTRKMSKSDEAKSYIALTDQPEVIKKKIMSAVTETEFDLNSTSPAITNLLNIYRAFSGEKASAVTEKFSSGGYRELKEALADTIINHLSPVQKKYLPIRLDEANLKNILAAGAATAAQTANQTLQKAKQNMGLL